MVEQFADIWGSMIPTVTKFTQNVLKKTNIKLLIGLLFSKLSQVIPSYPSFLRNFKVVHPASPRFPQKIIFNKIPQELFFLKISYQKLQSSVKKKALKTFLKSNSSSILSVSNILPWNIYIHCAGKLINTHGRSAALYFHQCCQHTF